MYNKSFIPEVYRKYLPYKGVVYDIGAHEGELTIGFIQMGFDVYAFEGAPCNISTLSTRVAGRGNATIYSIALGTEDKDLLANFNNSINPGPSGIYPEQFIKYRILEKFIKDEGIPYPDFVKMDIEGMESVVLIGCKKLLEVIRPIWQLSLHETIEFKSENYPGFVSKEKGGFDFKRFLELNYKLFDLNMCPVNQISGDNEFFIIPKEKFL